MSLPQEFIDHPRVIYTSLSWVDLDKNYQAAGGFHPTHDAIVMAWLPDGMAVIQLDDGRFLNIEIHRLRAIDSERDAWADAEEAKREAARA